MKPAYYVAMGASAGGVGALEQFFKEVPDKTGMAFIVVQHLSPDYKSLMDEILAKHTKMPIAVATTGTQVMADHIYLNPPKKNLGIFHGKLVVSDIDKKTFNLPIDNFFQTLSIDQAEKAIAIVLSGTGSDGSRGIKHIKENGGVVFAQSLKDAQFDGMPGSAINSGMVDFIMPVAELPEKLVSITEAGTGAIERVSEADELSSILLQLRQRFDIDFTRYKKNTLLRRLERRMRVNHSSSLSEYEGLVRESDFEANELCEA